METFFIPTGYLHLEQCVDRVVCRLDRGAVEELAAALTDYDAFTQAAVDCSRLFPGESKFEPEPIPKQAEIAERVGRAAERMGIAKKAAVEYLHQHLCDGTIVAYCMRFIDGEIETIRPPRWRTHISLAAFERGRWPNDQDDWLGTGSGIVLIRAVDLNTARTRPASEDALLTDEPDAQEQGREVSRATEFAMWMHGFLWGFKKAYSRVAKREYAIGECCEALGCTTREAEAAFEAAPYPELRNPPPNKRGRKGVGP